MENKNSKNSKKNNKLLSKKRKETPNKPLSINSHNKKFNIKYFDSIKIKYKINKKEEYIRLFSDNFVNKNKGKCKMIINDSYYDLIPIISLKNFGIKIIKEIFELELVAKYNCIDINEMFLNCPSLKSLPNFSEWKSVKNLNNITEKNEENKMIKNEIRLDIKVENKDLNKNIYFLCDINHRKQDNNNDAYLNTINFNNWLFELNESNTKLYINNIKK